jgi:hypothetical protein
MQLQPDLSHRLMLKSAFEQLFGESAWYELKETTSLAAWKKHTLKALRAIRISIRATVHVCDEPWLDEVHENLSRGEERTKESKDIDELLSCLTATLLRQVFLQLGTLPDRRGSAAAPLDKAHWRLDAQRSVQYVQSHAQRENVFLWEQRRLIGFEAQLDLQAAYRRSKSELAFSAWCQQRDSVTISSSDSSRD